MNTTEKKEVIIDRSEWRTGDESKYQTGIGDTELLNDHNYKCCLGFISLTAGCPAKDILGLSQPVDYSERCGKDIPQLSEKDLYNLSSYIETALSEEAMSINDDGHIHPKEKEKKLLELFEGSAYELKFVGEYNFVHNGCFLVTFYTGGWCFIELFEGKVQSWCTDKNATRKVVKDIADKEWEAHRGENMIISILEELNIDFVAADIEDIKRLKGTG